MPKLMPGDLDEVYLRCEVADYDIHAEMRSNILLVSGDHYTKKGSRFWQRIKDHKELTHNEKLRLTRNHVQRIVKTITVNILSQAPSTTIIPNNEGESQDD